MYKTILVPLDGSKEAETIMDYIEELAGRLQARVLILHIFEEPMILRDDEVIDVSAQQQKQRQKQTESYLKGVQKKLGEKGIEALYYIAYGPVVRTILIVAEQHDVDLIALSSRGLNGSFGSVWTSVTARLLQRIRCPVFLVRYENDE